MIHLKKSVPLTISVYQWSLLLLTLVFSTAGYAQWLIPKSIPIVNNKCKGNAAHYLAKRVNAAVKYPSGYFNYYINHYTVRLSPDFADNSLEGQTDFHFQPRGRLDTLVFDLASALGIDSIKFHGIKRTYTRNTDQLVLVKLDEPAKPQDTLSVWFSGLPAGGGLGTITYTNHGTGNLLATLSEPYGGRDWWATRQDYNQKIDSIDMYITTKDRGYKGVSNGLLVDSVKNGNTATWHWKHKYPIVNYLVAMAVSNYQVLKDTVKLKNGVMLLENYFFPQSRASWVRDAPNIKPQLHNFEKLFVPYGFSKEKYGHTQFSFGGGQEHQTNSFMFNLGFDLMSHELAHQWFGDVVTCKGMREIWLNEGFATYCEYLTDEFLNTGSLTQWKQSAVSASTGAANGSIYKYDTTNIWGIFDYATTYQKGGLFLHQLRKTIGDTAFFNGIKSYLTDPAIKYNLARTGDLERHFSAAAQTDLNPHFNAWIYQKGFPIYTLVNPKIVGDTLIFSITQRPSGTSNVFFPGAVPISFGNGVVQDTVIYVNHQVQGQQVKIVSRFKPTSLFLNASLDAITTAARFNVLLTSSVNSSQPNPKQLFCWPNPVNNELYINIPNTNSFSGQVQILDVQGKLVVNQPIIQGVTVDVSALQPGMYQIKLTTNEGTWQGKVAKQ